ncbi:hypothetical protein [Nocardia sp. R6R-6]|uniref:hypothetical protein n=1 Tax=Nocardia sp. R6R-6 TaxID=3459303 RepID=UPI00403DFCD6
MSGRVSNLLARNGITTLADLLLCRRIDLAAFPLVGAGTLGEIAAALSDRGLALLPDHGSEFRPSLHDQLRVALEHRVVLIALIARIRAADTPEIRDDIDTTLARLGATL